MKKFSCILLLSLSAFAYTASADVFDFSYNVFSSSANVQDKASGTITATYDPVHNDYDITAISGTSSAWGALTLLPAGAFEGNDNLLFYPTQPFIDFQGISFTVAGAGDIGTGDVNVFYTGGAYYEDVGDLGHPGTFSISPATSSVPEASSSALLLSVIGAIGATLWRRRKVRPA